MIRRAAELALDGRPGPKRPVPLLRWRHFVQISQRRQHRQVSNTLHIARPLETTVRNFQEEQNHQSGEKSHHTRKDRHHHDLGPALLDGDFFFGGRSKDLAVTRRVRHVNLRLTLPCR